LWRAIRSDPEDDAYACCGNHHGVWRDDIHPSSVWAGDMTDKGYPNAPLELEIYAGDFGVLRTEYGWFSVSKFASSPTTLSFDLDASHEVSPDALDLKIVQEAAAILSTERAWNRADNRKCPADALQPIPPPCQKCSKSPIYPFPQIAFYASGLGE